MPTNISQCLSCHKTCQSKDAVLCDECLNKKQVAKNRQGLTATPPCLACGKACKNKDTIFCNNCRPEYQVVTTVTKNKQRVENPTSGLPTTGACIPFNSTSQTNPGRFTAKVTKKAWKGRGDRPPFQNRSYSPAVPHIWRSDPGPRSRQTETLPSVRA